MPRQGLRSFLRETSAISERLAQIKKLSNTIIDSDGDYTIEKKMLIERARQLVSALTPDIVGAVLPDRLGLEAMTAPMYYADVYESEHIHVCLFGFKNCNFVFPLHDHPEMYGFLKVLRGAIALNSYTELSHDEHSKMRSTVKLNARSSNRIVYRFDGVTNCWCSDECVYLGPEFGNIHSLTPLEDGAAFFDLLIPGYGNNRCTYFKNMTPNPRLKQTCMLQKIAEPEDYYCQVLPYNKIKAL
ncbi:unnamed protein product [Thelazia callipaeda]|uniref:2-aminoethanethiol dioxygenase n=1 Tax=Thelazia callipaeda TaxID=103827 RepID=A0A0N5CPH8_THECL|nr:unnamed protein product [Thelazia callipaeda]